MWDKKPDWQILDDRIGLIRNENLHETKNINSLIDFCKNNFWVMGCSSEHINLMIGEQEYLIKILEVKNGEHWSEK